MSVRELLPPGLKARLKDLRLGTRLAAVGRGFGQHVSRARGAGLEFAQYRAYEPGDEPRQIDWKLYARSDKFFVRESERDSSLTVWLVLDLTASMAQTDWARPDYRKCDAAATLAAAVIELALRQGDAFGLVLVSGRGVRLVPAGEGPRQRDRCWLELARLEPEGRWPAETSLRPLWERVGAGSLVLIVSDGFDEAVLSLAERLQLARRDVNLVDILGVDERDFDLRGSFRFEDPETGEALPVDAGAARKAFLEKFHAAREALALRLRSAGVGHASHVLDESPDEALRRLFQGEGRR